MRKRTIAAAITFALIAGVVAYQAATHVEPEPYVELDTGRPRTPFATYACVNGQEMMTYTGASGEPLEATPTGQTCAAADQTTPAR